MWSQTHKSGRVVPGNRANQLQTPPSKGDLIIAGYSVANGAIDINDLIARDARSMLHEEQLTITEGRRRGGEVADDQSRPASTS